MAKLPYMQFYPSDYQADTRCISLAARGALVDILCTLWRSLKRGQKTLSLEGWAGELARPSAEVKLLLIELDNSGICDMNRENDEQITIKCRRMLRDERVRRYALKRLHKHRDVSVKRSCNADETPLKRPIYQKSYIRSQNQKSESEEELREKKEKKKKDCAMPSAAACTWSRYSEAYQARYKTPPVRNAKTNGQITQFLKRIPEQAAPEVAAFYVWHNDYSYIKAGHPVGLLLYNAETLHTQWKTGKAVTHSQAQQVDKTAGRLNVFQELREELYGKGGSHDRSGDGHADSGVRIDADGVIEADAKTVA